MTMDMEHLHDGQADALPLVLSGVCRAFREGEGQLEILRDANLALNPGELVALVAPSGAGKSTLLHIAGLLERPDSGEVLIGGVACEGLADAERTRMRRLSLGFVYQFHHLLPEFTALESVAMPARIGGAPKQEAESKAKALLEQLGLAERLNHRPAALSGGERQRVAIARALVNEPASVLMDEPTGNLDPDTAEQVLAAMSALRDRDTAFVVVTHDPAIAQRMDRQLTLANGRLEAR